MTRSGLTLPGDIPGLLRRGSPVVVADRDLANIPHHLRGRRGTVHAVAPSSLGVPLASMALDNIEHVIVAGLDVLALDLTDPTGRAHAAWWVWRQLSGDAMTAARSIGLAESVAGYDADRMHGLLDRCGRDDDAVDDYDSVPPDGNSKHDPEMLRDLVLTIAGRL